MVLGDENPESAGIALVPGDTVLRNIASLRDMLSDEKEENRMTELLQVEHLSKQYPGFCLARRFFLGKARTDYGTDWKKWSR